MINITDNNRWIPVSNKFNGNHNNYINDKPWHNKCNTYNKYERYNRDTSYQTVNRYKVDCEYMRKQRNDNYKKILCKNIINGNKCIYNDKCLYAHNLEEQNMDSIRKIAYDLIKKNDDLSYIDLSSNRLLYNNLICLSKVCSQCINGVCTGGYNCKHGACDKKYAICQTDLNKGTCNGECGYRHLTKKGLVPYGKCITMKIRYRTLPKPTIIDENFFKNLSKVEEIDNIENNQNDEESDKLSVFSNESDENGSFENLSMDEEHKQEDMIKKSIFMINMSSI